MKIIIEISDELVKKVIRGIMDNFPEASSGSALRCTDWQYKTMRFDFVDVEENKIHKLDKAKLIADFPLMFTDKWPKGCTKLPVSRFTWEDMEEWLCQADAIDFDAFVQLACFGEVIYG